MNNLFIYQDNLNDNILSNLFRNLIYLYSTCGKNINVFLLNKDNLSKFINIPENFNLLKENIQYRYIKYSVLYNWGGIWFENNVLIINRFDYLFDYLKSNDGFFIKDNNIKEDLCGFNANTSLLSHILENLHLDINQIFIKNKELFSNVYFHFITDYRNSILFSQSYNEYILIKNYQKLIFLIIDNNSSIERDDLFGNKYIINYFINKSFENLNFLDDLDFIEIGTSHFETLIQNSENFEKGISIDAVKYYVDALPNKHNVKKINIGISDKNDTAYIYYIPPNIINLLELPVWFYGCNSLNCYHPYHIENKLEKYVTIEKINIIPTYELFYKNKVRKVNLLKIDTEGHDHIILHSLYNYIKYLPKIFYPNKIIFEVQVDANKNNLEKTDNIIKLYEGIGYKLIKKEWDAIIELV